MLRDEAERYATRLRDEEVAVEVLRYPGQIHGFWSLGGVSEVPDLVNAEIASSIDRLIEA